jgi:hypothetical protein
MIMERRFDTRNRTSSLGAPQGHGHYRDEHVGLGRRGKREPLSGPRQAACIAPRPESAVWIKEHRLLNANPMKFERRMAPY